MYLQFTIAAQIDQLCLVLKWRNGNGIAPAKLLARAREEVAESGNLTYGIRTYSF